MSLRFSVPSYVLPGTYVENLRFLDEHSSQRQVELLFFIYDDEAKALLLQEHDDIVSFSPRFSFTVHMPDSVDDSHDEIIDATNDIASHYIIHPPREAEGLRSFVRLMDDWRMRYGADRFLLENTKLDPFYAAEEALLGSRFGPPRLCADIGHLRLEGVDPAPWIAEREKRISEIHVHGFDGRHDHVPFYASETWLRDLSAFAGTFKGIVEIELFSWAELEDAQAILRKEWEHE